MDYTRVYNNAFSNTQYSNSHHIQYDYVTQNIEKLNLNTNRIIDIGSGRGQLIRSLNHKKDKLSNYSITSVDLNMYHSENVDNFIRCDLSSPVQREALLEKQFDILTCTDVLEHLDKSFIEDVLRLYSNLSTYSILAIANHSDIIDGVELHTIQQNDTWWENYILKYFSIVDKQTFYNGRLYMYVCKTQ
jgi:cyclopropane fatty-acyl-phospholipid synthase-like methyltransferase